MNKWIDIGIGVIVLSLALSAGYYMGATVGKQNLAEATSAWEKERANTADAAASAEAAQRRAEQGQAEAINQAATNYQKGKADAEASSAATVADLRSGALRLRDEWATCRATSAAVSSASGGHRPDGGTGDREASAGRIVRAAAECDAHVRGLQAALMGERAGQ